MDKHSKDVNAASFSPDGRYIVSGGYDHRLLLWDGHDGGFLRALAEDMENKVFAVTFSPDGERVLASSQGTSAGFTAIYELASGERVTRFRGHNNIVLASAWHPAGSLVASAGGDDEDIYLWRPDSGEVVHHLRGDGRSGLAVAFSKRGGLQVAFGQTSEGKGLLGNHLQRTFDFVAFTLEDLPADQPNPPEFRRTVVQRDGAELQKGGSSTLLIGDSRKIDDPAGGALIRSFTYTKSGQIVVGCSRNKRLQLFSDSGEPLREFIGHEGEVWAVSPSPDDRYLASASGDQTVRLWNLQTGELLASLFVSRDSEWVVWTPSGHYHASPGGEKYIGWHINRGVGRVADYYPAYVFREKFHHPELVKRTVLLGSFEKALAEVGADAVDVNDLLPPKIDWILPQATRGGPTGEDVTVRAEISSSSAELEEVKLLVNGKALSTEFRVSGNSLTYEETVTLLPGENRLAIFARNANSGHTSDERVVNVRGATKPGEKLSTADDLDGLLKPDLYVLSVGVSDYENKTIPSLNYCDDDAVAIASHFQKQSGGLFGEVEARLLVNESATELDVQDGLDWLEDNATQQDFVVLFLAAHGINDEKGNFYLLPYDADPERLRSTGVAWDDFGDVLGNLPSRVLMFLDTCHSGRLGANLFTLANVDGARTRSVGGLRSAFDPSEAIRELTSEENGVVIMAASTGDEASVEHDDWGHGAFTMGLLDGLGGKADVNGDEIIHLRELDFFVSDRVKELTEGAQHPTTVKPSTISRLPVAAVR